MFLASFLVWYLSREMVRSAFVCCLALTAFAGASGPPAAPDAAVLAAAIGEAGAAARRPTTRGRRTKSAEESTEASAVENEESAENNRVSWFKSIDADGSGELSFEELAAEYRTIDPSASMGEIEEMFRGADADGSGELDMDEVSYSI